LTKRNLILESYGLAGSPEVTDEIEILNGQNHNKDTCDNNFVNLNVCFLDGKKITI
jgi:hypothetical protein